MLARMSAILVWLLYTFPQIANAQSSSPASKDKLDRLIVYGEGFVFGVKEPDQWRADTGDVARKYRVNVFLAPVQAIGGSKAVNIRVRINSKVDENTVEDLNYDMEQYKKKFPTAEFSNLSVAHPEYKTFARLVCVPDQFYEYVAYINPGPRSKFMFSTAMSKDSKPATAEEWKAYETVLKSLVWLPAGSDQK